MKKVRVCYSATIEKDFEIPDEEYQKIFNGENDCLIPMENRIDDENLVYICSITDDETDEYIFEY